MEHRYFVYILTNSRRTVLYTGVTNGLVRRVSQHRDTVFRRFTHDDFNNAQATIARFAPRNDMGE